MQLARGDRPRDPCPDCGEELYDKFWGSGGWAPTEIATDKMHGSDDCVKRLKARLRGDCAACGGSGRVNVMGEVSVIGMTDCPTCHGTGRAVVLPTPIIPTVEVLAWMAAAREAEGIRTAPVGDDEHPHDLYQRYVDAQKKAAFALDTLTRKVIGR
jgi:hypothetical protein